MRILPALLLILALLCGCTALGEQVSPSVVAPELIRPGQSADFTITAAVDCTATLALVSAADSKTHRILSGTDLLTGENSITWNGLLPSGQSPEPGAYSLQVQVLGATIAETVLRIGEPYPQLTIVAQSARTFPDGEDLVVSIIGNEDGTLRCQIIAESSGEAIHETTQSVVTGINTYIWNGTGGDEAVPSGEYALRFTLENGAGEISEPADAPVTMPAGEGEMPDFNQITAALFETYDIKISPPYSMLGDGSYWCMNPGETDDDVIWDILTQPITVFDDGKINAIGHVYLRENPDGTGRATAQIHGLSQGLHVIGDVNEHGYVLVEAFSNYDPDYQPYTEEEKAHAFDICQGYIRADCLKTVEVQQDIGFVIDKLTQRMYMFRDGKRVTEFYISTGLITNEKYFYETIAGEFITIAHGSGYWSGDLFTDLPIRFNGGTMLHEVCCYVIDETRYYGIFESRLGSKHSSGCVRVPYWENEEGYNMLWIYRNLQRGEPYKIIIWDDRNRNDTPTVWR